MNRWKKKKTTQKVDYETHVLCMANDGDDVVARIGVSINFINSLWACAIAVYSVEVEVVFITNKYRHIDNKSVHEWNNMYLTLTLLSPLVRWKSHQQRAFRHTWIRAQNLNRRARACEHSPVRSFARSYFLLSISLAVDQIIHLLTHTLARYGTLCQCARMRWECYNFIFAKQFSLLHTAIHSMYTANIYSPFFLPRAQKLLKTNETRVKNNNKCVKSKNMYVNATMTK